MRQFSAATMFVRYRAWLTVAVLLFSGLAVWGLTFLTFDDNPRRTIRSNDDRFRRMEELFQQFGSDEMNCILLVKSNHLFTRAALKDLRGLVADVEEIVGVEDVLSLVDKRLIVFKPIPHTLIPDRWPKFLPQPDKHWLPEVIAEGFLIRAKHEALQHPLVADYLLTRDAKATLVLVRLSADNETVTELQPIVTELRAAVRRWNAQGNLSITMTGLPVVRTDAFAATQRETAWFLFLGVAVTMCLALLIFRRLAIVLIICSAGFAAVIWTMGMLGLAGGQITIISTQLPMLVLIICFTDAIHLIVDARFGRAQGQPPKEVVKHTLRHMTFPCALTSLTTAIGFGSLYFTQTELIQRFGLACSGGAIGAFLGVITIVPLLSSTRLGKGVLPPAGGSWSKPIASAFAYSFSLIWHLRWAITVGGIILFFVLAATVMQIQAESNLSEILPPHSETSKALMAVDEEFGGVLTVHVILEWPRGYSSKSPKVKEALTKIEQICQDHPRLHHPMSILTIYKAVPPAAQSFVPDEVTKRFVRDDLHRAIVVSRVRDLGAIEHEKTLRELTDEFARLERRFPGFEVHVSGTSMVGSESVKRMITDLTKSLAVASIVIFGILTLAFRSLRLGLIALLPNCLPLLFTAAFLVWIGEALRLTHVLVFSICLGIAVDDTIHFISRFQRELAGEGDVKAALRRTQRAVGTALIVSTIVLVVGFSLLSTSEFPLNRMFGLLACIAICSALLGDLIILPAMLGCFVKSKPIENDDAALPKHSKPNTHIRKL